jgi:hypothetical protein
VHGAHHRKHSHDEAIASVCGLQRGHHAAAADAEERGERREIEERRLIERNGAQL